MMDIILKQNINRTIELIIKAKLQLDDVPELWFFQQFESLNHIIECEDLGRLYSLRMRLEEIVATY